MDQCTNYAETPLLSASPHGTTVECVLALPLPSSGITDYHQLDLDVYSRPPISGVKPSRVAPYAHTMNDSGSRNSNVTTIGPKPTKACGKLP